GPPGGPMPEGRLFAVSLESPAKPAGWDPVPGEGNLGGMWGWGGVSIDPTDGRVFTGVGNSSVWSEDCACYVDNAGYGDSIVALRSEEHTSELQSRGHLVCRLLLEKKKIKVLRCECSQSSLS